ncbi:NAD-dependent epimerase/dehydratase family protein [soil metagenome]
MSAILVTGASGFVGQALCDVLLEKKIDFIPVIRPTSVDSARHAAWPKPALIDDIGAATDWQAHLKDVTTVVHLAARVHLTKEVSENPLRDYRLTNVDATLHLARQSARAGVKRLIYLSSIKVNGEATTGHPFRASDQAAPVDPYAVSKWEAEQGLAEIARETGLQVVIIRPPLVYGPGVRANFLALMRWVSRGIPLPLAQVDNRRSMIYVGNLVDLIVRCAVSDAAAGKTFLASDAHDVSSAELIRVLASAMGKRSALFSIPPPALRALAGLAGKRAAADRLLGSLQLDMQDTTRTLGWTPPFSFEAGIEVTVREFRRSQGAAL